MPLFEGPAQRFHVAVEERQHNLDGFSECRTRLLARQHESNGETTDVEVEAALSGLVEVIDIVMNAVFRLEGAVVFRMDVGNQVHFDGVAAGRRGIVKIVEDVPGKEMKERPEKSKGTDRHAGDLEAYQLGVPERERPVVGLKFDDGVAHENT